MEVNLHQKTLLIFMGTSNLKSHSSNSICEHHNTIITETLLKVKKIMTAIGKQP